MKLRLQRHMNALLLGSFLALTVIYLTGIVIKERSNTRQIHYLTQEAVRKDSVRDERIEGLQSTLTVVTQGLDSLKERYVTDSIAWQQERVQLTGNLRQQKRTVQAVTKAYERNKAMQTTKIKVDKLPSVSEDEWENVRRRRRVDDLSPILGDSTGQ